MTKLVGNIEPANVVSIDIIGGAKGEPGKDGKDGVDGYTPIKGVDYFDGKDGVDGKQGPSGDPFVYDDFTPEQLALLKGDKGNSGVYAGTTPPTDPEVKVFIDLTGESDDIATKQYVDTVVNTALDTVEDLINAVVEGN